MHAPSAHIVGRGIIGLSVGLALQERGWRIFVIGPGELPGTATLAASGISSLKGQISAAKPLFAIKMHGHRGLLRWLERLERLSGRPIRRSFGGIDEPFYTATGFAGINERVFHSRFSGCLNVELIPPDQLHPAFRGARGAFRYRGDGWFDPGQCLAALEQLLRMQGAEFIDASVTKIEAGPDQALSLATTIGPLAAQQVVLAAGIYSNTILEASQVYDLSQEPVEGETSVYSGLGSTPPLLARSGKINLIVDQGDLWVGSTSRRRASVAACAPLASAFDELAEAASPLFPALFPAAVTAEGRWGIRGRFRDQSPVLGPVSLPGSALRRFWMASGAYKSGLQLAHIMARELASQLSGAPPTPLFTPFLPTRYRPL